jgi:hypothetical protein
MEMQEGRQPRSGVVEMPACRPKDTVENAEAMQRSAVTVEHNCNAALESLLENGDNRLWFKASCREDTTVGPLNWCRGPRTETSERSEPGP